MAEEVLMNDGGAPARILPFTAKEAITAGAAIAITETADVLQAKLADEDGVPVAGFALTGCAAGAICNVISGSGVIVNALVDGDSVNVGIGEFLEIGENGTLIGQASPGDKTVVAVALEKMDDAVAAGVPLTKVLVL